MTSYATLKRRRDAKKKRPKSHNSTIARGVAAKRPKKAVKKRNPKRRASEFKRCYHSVQRVDFVKSLPCLTCRVQGYSENAHVPSRSGMGRKGPYTKIVPLCGSRFSVFGCHAELDCTSRGAFEAAWNVNLDAAAAETERRWLAHLKQDERDGLRGAEGDTPKQETQ